MNLIMQAWCGMLGNFENEHPVVMGMMRNSPQCGVCAMDGYKLDPFRYLESQDSKISRGTGQSIHIS